MNVSLQFSQKIKHMKLTMYRLKHDNKINKIYYGDC